MRQDCPLWIFKKSVKKKKDTKNEWLLVNDHRRVIPFGRIQKHFSRKRTKHWSFLQISLGLFLQNRLQILQNIVQILQKTRFS